MGRITLLLLFPTLLAFVPMEIVGISPTFLQRIPVGAAGIQISDIILVLSWVFLIILVAHRGLHIDWMVTVIVLQVVIAIIYFVGFNYTTLTLSIGPFLTATSVVVFYLARFAGNPYRSTRQIHWVFGTLGFFLVLHSAALFLIWIGFVSPSPELVIVQERYGGEAERLRWVVARNSDRMVLSTVIAWATFRALRYKRWYLLVIPISGLLHQLMNNSRGGLVLVFVSIIIALLFYTRGEWSSSAVNRRWIAKWTVLSALVIVFFGLIFINEGALTTFSQIKEIWDEESIRTRMWLQVAVLFLQAPWFGNGYFDLFSRPEWSQFHLDHIKIPIHNVILQYAVIYGVLGTIPFILVNLGIAGRLIWVYKHAAALPVRLVEYVAICGALYASLFYMIMLQSLGREAYLFIWTCFGVMYRITDLAKDKKLLVIKTRQNND